MALPHPAWVEYKKRTGKMITDSLALEIAGHYLKTALEAGEGLGREMYSLTIEETLAHLEGASAGRRCRRSPLRNAGSLPLHHDRFFVFAEDSPHRVRNLSHRRLGFDGRHNPRHQIRTRLCRIFHAT